MLLHRAERLFDEPRLVASVRDVEIRWKLGPKRLDAFFHCFDDIERIRPGLFTHFERHRRASVESRERSRLFEAIDHVADIADADELPAIGDDDASEFLRLLNASEMKPDWSRV